MNTTKNLKPTTKERLEEISKTTKDPELKKAIEKKLKEKEVKK